MVTEEICRAIVKHMFGAGCTLSNTLLPDGADPIASRVAFQHAIARQDLYDGMLRQFDVRAIEDAIAWLQVRGFVSAFGLGLSPAMGYELTPKGQLYGESGEMADDDRRRLSGKIVNKEPEFYGVTVKPRELLWRVKRIFLRRGKRKRPPERRPS